MAFDSTISFGNGRERHLTSAEQPRGHYERECGLPIRYTAADINLAEAARWRVLAKTLDDPHENDSAAIITTYVLRLEALLEDEFDGNGRDLAEKARSVRTRISSELLIELLAVCAMQERGADWHDVADVSASCDRAAVHLLGEAADAQPRTDDGCMAHRQWILRHPAVAGVVRKIRKHDDGLHHVAVVDLDGHLIDLRTSKIIRIDPGDRVVLLRSGKHDATDYYNVTQKIGLEPPSAAATYKVLFVGAGLSILGTSGVVLTILLAIRSIHRWADLPALLKLVVVGVPSVLAACAGFGTLILGATVGVVMVEFRRAVAKETEAR